MGARLLDDFPLVIVGTFQSTRPHGARLTSPISAASTPSFQSTRPHGGATTDLDVAILSDDISIHAPAWGRDEAMNEVLQNARISIHAPAWGRDGRGIASMAGGINFNPRARMGARREIERRQQDGQDFNPRARMGARLGAMPLFGHRSGFQSTRPHGGATLLTPTKETTDNISIHAPAWGRDVSLDPSYYANAHFNPRARMGARLKL